MPGLKLRSALQHLAVQSGPVLQPHRGPSLSGSREVLTHQPQILFEVLLSGSETGINEDLYQQTPEQLSQTNPHQLVTCSFICHMFTSWFWWTLGQTNWLHREWGENRYRGRTLRFVFMLLAGQISQTRNQLVNSRRNTFDQSERSLLLTVSLCLTHTNKASILVKHRNEELRKEKQKYVDPDCLWWLGETFR